MVRLRSLGRPPLWLNATTPGWFETMGTPLRSGRDFNAADRVGSRPVAIVNEAFVRQYLNGEQAIGQRVRLGSDANTHHEIVGVVADAVYTTPREGMLATMYLPVAQQAPASFLADGPPDHQRAVRPARGLGARRRCGADSGGSDASRSRSGTSINSLRRR